MHLPSFTLFFFLFLFFFFFPCPELPALDAQAAKHTARAQRRRQEEARRQLLAGHAPADARHGAAAADDLYLQEQQSLRGARGRASQLEETGATILAQLGHQRETMLAMRERMLGGIDTLLTSAGLMRDIERRERMDKIVIYSGMLLVLLIMLFVYWFVRK